MDELLSEKLTAAPLGAYLSGVELVRTPSNLVGDYQHFQGNFCSHLQGRR
jgi:hypothetical protein